MILTREEIEIRLSAHERREFKESCARLARAIAPSDLQTFPLYIVLVSEIPAAAQGGGYHGMTLANAGPDLRGIIGKGWRGIGPVIVLNDIFTVPVEACILAAALGATCRNLEDFAKPIYFRVLSAILLHELTHVLEDAATYGKTCTPVSADTSEPAEPDHNVPILAAAAQEGPAGISEHYARVPLLCHGWRFHRIAAHVVYRARRSGTSIMPREVVNSPYYGLLPLDDYLQALGDEPAWLAELSFAEIGQMSPPAAFRELWTRSVEQWRATTTATMQTWTSEQQLAFNRSVELARGDLEIL